MVRTSIYVAMNKNDIGESFHKLIVEMYVMHGGLRFEITSAGFVHKGILCRDTHEMDILVEQERHSLGNSIREPENK